MSDSDFYKCACENCQGHLEFPAHAAGITATCPHCGVETRLAAPASPAPPPTPPTPVPPPDAEPEAPPPVAAGPPASKLKRVLNLAGSALVGLAVLAYFGWKGWRTYRKTERVIEAVKSEPSSSSSTSKPGAGTPPAPPAAPATSVLIAAGKPPPRKSGEDLQVLNFEVHKAKDGNLQYVVGTVTNHSARQYFNVKLTFDLTRTGGKPGDTATDSLRNLPANGGSTFKVNIIGTTPVTAATLTKLEGEQE